MEDVIRQYGQAILGGLATVAVTTVFLAVCMGPLREMILHISKYLY